MKKLFSWSLLMLLFSAETQARSPVPLMPPRVQRYTANSMKGASSTATAAASASEPMTLGVELGALGRISNLSSDFLGMQMLFGGRILSLIPVFNDFYVKPSIGLFYRDESVGSTGVNQFVVEGGANVYYALVKSGQTKWLVGLGQKLDFQRSSITVGTASTASPFALSYRLGPATGLSFLLVNGWSLDVNAEYTFGLGNMTGSTLSTTVGMMFQL